MNFLTRDLIGLICDFCQYPEIKIVLTFYQLVTKRPINYYVMHDKKIASYKETNARRNISYWLAKGFNTQMCKHAAKYNKTELLAHLDINYVAFFYGAARGNNMRAIKEMLPKVAKRSDFDSIINYAAYGAAVSANKNLLKYFILLGADCHNLMAYGSGRSGIPIVLNIGFSINAFRNEIFVGACYGGHLNLAILFSPNSLPIWSSGLYKACLKNRLDIVEFIVKKNRKFNTGILARLKRLNRDFIWNVGYRGAVEGKHQKLMSLMLELGALC